MTVSRSGTLYLVHAGGVGLLIDPARPGAGAPGLLGSILAHANVQESWEDLPADAKLPPSVAEVVARWRREVPAPVIPGAGPPGAGSAGA